MTLDRSRPLGAFPEVGPLSYLNVPPDQVRKLLRPPWPDPTVWFHATWAENLASILRWGLIPSCWTGGDCCCVCGYDSLDQIRIYRQDAWILEILSAGLPGQLKAWWVPPTAIRGFWHRGLFTTVTESLRTSAPSPAILASCGCDLASLVDREVDSWRSATIATFAS